MKSLKRFSLFILTFGLLLGLVTIKSETASAANAKATVPKSVRITSNAIFESAIQITPASYGDKIKNLKISSKNLKVKQSLINYDQSVKKRKLAFSLYAKKTGTYYVTFNICDSKGKKKSSHKITVYVKNDLPIKSITYGGESMKMTSFDEWILYTDMSFGKFKVTMNKGYKLKKIQYVSYVSYEGDYDEYVTMKNNKKINLPLTWGDDEEEEEMSEFCSLMEVTYVDKYTKKEKKANVNLILNDWSF